MNVITHYNTWSSTIGYRHFVVYWKLLLFSIVFFLRHLTSMIGCMRVVNNHYGWVRMSESCGLRQQPEDIVSEYVWNGSLEIMKKAKFSKIANWKFKNYRKYNKNYTILICQATISTQEQDCFQNCNNKNERGLFQERPSCAVGRVKCQNSIAKEAAPF